MVIVTFDFDYGASLKYRKYSASPLAYFLIWFVPILSLRETVSVKCMHENLEKTFSVYQLLLEPALIDNYLLLEEIICLH